MSEPRHRLLLMRHAKSEWGSGAGSDFDRPLAPRGERDAPRMGDWIRTHDYVPDRVVSSPALRARQTVLAAGAVWGLREQDVIWDETIYGADIGELLSILEGYCRSPGTLLLVGHNPGMEELLVYVTGGKSLPKGDKVMPTGAVAVLNIRSTDRLSQGCARVEAMMRPKLLEED